MCIQDDSNSVSVSVDPSGLNVQKYKYKRKPIAWGNCDCEKKWIDQFVISNSFTVLKMPFFLDANHINLNKGLIAV